MQMLVVCIQRLVHRAFVPKVGNAQVHPTRFDRSSWDILTRISWLTDMLVLEYKGYTNDIRDQPLTLFPMMWFWNVTAHGVVTKTLNCIA